MLRGRLHLLLLPCAALLAICPLLVTGCSCGHDLTFHLVSWLDAAAQFSHGNFHPRWATLPAWGAGEPRFVFYPPASWTLGALLTLLLTHLPRLDPARAFALAPILYTWLALTAAGFSMHALARRFTSPPASLLVATLYLANPYTLFTAFERTAFAELLAAAILPLLFLAILEARPRPTRIALAVALLWLTNAPAAVMGSYALAFFAVAHLLSFPKSRSRPRQRAIYAARILSGTLLGLALAAIYILPAAIERRWVLISMAVIPGLRIEDSTLFHHSGDPAHDAVVHTASLLALLLCLATGIAISISLRRQSSSLQEPQNTSPPEISTGTLTAEPADSPTERLPLALALFAALILFLLTPASLPIWRHAPELAFLQFPWRLLALLAVVLALSVAFALRSVPLTFRSATAVSIPLALILALTSWQAFRQACDPEDTPQSIYAQIRSGTGVEPTDEYTPQSADNDALAPNNPAFELLAPGTPLDAPPPAAAHASPAPGDLSLDLPTPETLVLNLRDFPAWHITRNGADLPTRLHRDDGLLAIPLPAGHSDVELTYTHTPDELTGDLLSFLALITLPLLHRRNL